MRYWCSGCCARPEYDKPCNLRCLARQPGEQILTVKRDCACLSALRPDAFDSRDAVNPPLEARMPHPCGKRPRSEHAGATVRYLMHCEVSATCVTRGHPPIGSSAQPSKGQASLAVGAPVTRCPLHSPGRAVFPHPVPRLYSRRARQHPQADTLRLAVATIRGFRNRPRSTACQKACQVKLIRLPPRRFSHLNAQVIAQR